MEEKSIIPTNRLEAFSDGVIAIILTIMVLELHFEGAVDEDNFMEQFHHLLPSIISYAVSFVMVGVLWVNHHHLFHAVKGVDNKLLWLNLLLLFWMSLIPFATGFIGNNPLLWVSSVAYGAVFLMNAFSFTLIRKHILKHQHAESEEDQKHHSKTMNKNTIAMGLYVLAMLLSPVSVYISFGLFGIVPIMYLSPQIPLRTN